MSQSIYDISLIERLYCQKTSIKGALAKVILNCKRNYDSAFPSCFEITFHEVKISLCITSNILIKNITFEGR